MFLQQTDEMLLCYNIFPLHDPVKRFWKPSEHNTDQYTISLYDIKMISSPNIHIQILQTDLHTSTLRISCENLIKDHGIFSMVIILLILITLSLDSEWILLGENWCWTLSGLKGLIRFFILLHEKFLQFDWLRTVVFQLNLKYLHVKITNLLRVVV